MGRFKRKLSFYILTRFIIWLAVFTILLAVAFVAIIKLGTSQSWQPSFLYSLLHFMYGYTVQFFVMCWTIGFILIFIRFWVKTLGYLEKVIKAAEALHKSENELIILPDVLKEVENQMNQIKLNMRASEQAAREVEQRKNDLLVYMAHDLKTPLTSITGYLNLLADEAHISEGLRQKYTSVLLEKAGRLEDLIDEFFEITRYNLQTMDLDKSRVNLTRIIEQVAHEFGPLFSEKNLTCNLSVEQGIMMECDPSKMRRVFDNLIKNAVSYSFKGTAVTITGGLCGNFVKLKFKNEGSTIPPEKLGRVFEQFYRSDEARATGTGGAGLGLAIAKEIISLHGGSISASSENDAIEFEIALPAAP